MGGSITGFQLVYDKWTDAKAFTWVTGKGHRHDRVEGYDANRYVNPVLVRDGSFDAKSIADEFFKHCDGVDKEVVQLVLRVMTAYDPARDDRSL